MKPTLQQIKNTNDDYMNSIYAILGFMNIYKYELRHQSFKVGLFQGRTFDKTNPAGNQVTPDIAIIDSPRTGVIGEVKNNFPKEEKYWLDDFKQLLNYDDVLIGWPTVDEKVETHDIVLLTHESRSRAIRDFYHLRKDNELKFTRPFVIVEYGRSDQGKQYFKFRIEDGKLTNTIVHSKLYNGIQIPMQVFVTDYSKIKIYDGSPHLSWLLYVIHLSMIDKATADGTYVKLGKKTKVAIKTSVSEIIELLRENYSFKQIHGSDTTRQQSIPKKEWVLEAIEKLVATEEAKWIGMERKELTYYLKRHEGESAKEYYERITIDSTSQDQLTIFDTINQDKSDSQSVDPK